MKSLADIKAQIVRVQQKIDQVKTIAALSELATAAEGNLSVLKNNLTLIEREKSLDASLLEVPHSPEVREFWGTGLFDHSIEDYSKLGASLDRVDEALTFTNPVEKKTESETKSQADFPEKMRQITLALTTKAAILTPKVAKYYKKYQNGSEENQDIAVCQLRLLSYIKDFNKNPSLVVKGEFERSKFSLSAQLEVGKILEDRCDKLLVAFTRLEMGQGPAITTQYRAHLAASNQGRSVDENYTPKNCCTIL